VHDRSMFFFWCKVLWSTNDPPWMKVLKQQMWLDRVVAQGIDEKYWSQHLGHVATDDGDGSWLSCRVPTEMPWIELKRTANASARYKLYLFSFHRFRRVSEGLLGNQIDIWWYLCSTPFSKAVPRFSQPNKIRTGSSLGRGWDPNLSVRHQPCCLC
jgi:hypothetical protein